MPTVAPIPNKIASFVQKLQSYRIIYIKVTKLPSYNLFLFLHCLKGAGVFGTSKHKALEVQTF